MLFLFCSQTTYVNVNKKNEKKRREPVLLLVPVLFDPVSGVIKVECFVAALAAGPVTTQPTVTGQQASQQCNSVNNVRTGYPVFLA